LNAELLELNQQRQNASPPARRRLDPEIEALESKIKATKATFDVMPATEGGSEEGSLAKDDARIVALGGEDGKWAAIQQEAEAVFKKVAARNGGRNPAFMNKSDLTAVHHGDMTFFAALDADHNDNVSLEEWHTWIKSIHGQKGGRRGDRWLGALLHTLTVNLAGLRDLPPPAAGVEEPKPTLPEPTLNAADPGSPRWKDEELTGSDRAMERRNPKESVPHNPEPPEPPPAA